MNRDEKREVVERLVTQIKESKALIVTDYRGLTVTQTAELRRTLREAGASFHIAKNTLARLAAEQAERPTLIEFLEGPTAIAFIEDDPAATAKRLSEVARTTRILAVKGGVMNGHTLSADQIRELGDLPPRQTLLSQVVGAIVGPMQLTVGVLNAPLRDIVAVLDAYIQKRQEAEGAEAPAAAPEPEAAAEPEAAEEAAPAAEEPAAEPEAAAEPEPAAEPEAAEADEPEAAETPDAEADEGEQAEAPAE